MNYYVTYSMKPCLNTNTNSAVNSKQETTKRNMNFCFAAFTITAIFIGPALAVVFYKEPNHLKEGSGRVGLFMFD